jgi:hypothetical protein
MIACTYPRILQCIAIVTIFPLSDVTHHTTIEATPINIAHEGASCDSVSVAYTFESLGALDITGWFPYTYYTLRNMRREHFSIHSSLESCMAQLFGQLMFPVSTLGVGEIGHLNTLMEHMVKLVKEFVVWCRPRLGLQGKIRITLVNHELVQGKQYSFAHFDPQANTIRVCVKDRHPIDVLRSLAHELVHQAQGQRRELTSEDGVTGSDIENEANALAGILMRLWNQEDRR